MKMERMSIVGLVIEGKAVTRACPQSLRLLFGVKALAVNRPVIEYSRPPLILPNTSGMVSSGGGATRFAERRALPPFVR